MSNIVGTRTEIVNNNTSKIRAMTKDEQIRLLIIAVKTLKLRVAKLEENK